MWAAVPRVITAAEPHRRGGHGSCATEDTAWRGQEKYMRANRIIANLHVADVDTAKGFYAGYLGLRTEEFNMGWVARYTSPETGANIQLVTRDATSSADSAVSVLTDDVDSAYAEAQELGFTWSRALEGRSPARASRARGRPR